MRGDSEKGGLLSSFRRMFGGGKRDQGATDDELVLDSTMQTGPSSIGPSITEMGDELALTPPAAPSAPAGNGVSPSPIGADEGEIVSRAGTIFETDAGDVPSDADAPVYDPVGAAAAVARAAEDADDRMISAVIEMVESASKPEGESAADAPEDTQAEGGGTGGPADAKSRDAKSGDDTESDVSKVKSGAVADDDAGGEAKAAAAKGDAPSATGGASVDADASGGASGAADTASGSDSPSGSDSIRAFLADINQGVIDAGAEDSGAEADAETDTKPVPAEAAASAGVGKKSLAIKDLAREDAVSADARAVAEPPENETPSDETITVEAPAKTPSDAARPEKPASSVDEALDAVVAALSSSPGASGLSDGGDDEPAAGEHADARADAPPSFARSDVSDLEPDEDMTEDKPEPVETADPDAAAEKEAAGEEAGASDFQKVLKAALDEAERENPATAAGSSAAAGASAESGDDGGADTDTDEVADPDADAAPDEEAAVADSGEEVGDPDFEEVLKAALDEAQHETSAAAAAAAGAAAASNADDDAEEPAQGFDRAELEDIIRQVVRDELQSGELGDNLSRNIVRMINDAVDAKLGDR